MRRLFLVLALASCNKTTPSPAPVPSAPAVPDLSITFTPSPKIPLTRLDGQTIDLASVRKKVTLIAEWGTFCEPCLQELPLIQKVYEAKKNDPDVSIVAVSVDDMDSDVARAKVADAAKKLGLTFPIFGAGDTTLLRYIDRHGDLSSDGGFTLDLPAVALLLSNGRGFYENGYEPAKSATYVAQHIKLIDDAKRGELPVEGKATK